MNLQKHIPEISFLEEQREEVVRQFIFEITGNHAPWVVAFHDFGKDESNLHAHIAIRDRDPWSESRCGYIVLFPIIYIITLVLMVGRWLFCI